MIRDDIVGCPEPPCPRRKKTPWVPLLLVVVAGLGAAHWAGLTGPLASLATQFGRGSGRDMGTPSGRLVGEWESRDDPMFPRVTHAPHKKSWSGTGAYLADDGSDMTDVIFKVVSEDRSGTDLDMAEFLPRANLNVTVTYSVARDGLSMTRQYDRNGTRVSSRYRYVGPPSEFVANRMR